MFLLGQALGESSAEDAIEQPTTAVGHPFGHGLCEWPSDQFGSPGTREAQKGIVHVPHDAACTLHSEHRFGGELRKISAEMLQAEGQIPVCRD
jgi:hypothetical protein